MKDIDLIIEKALQGDKYSTSRLISLVERKDTQARYIVDRMYPFSGNTFYLGITGPPGAGKSTLVNRLIEKFGDDNYSVAVVAVDPCSAYTNGALLGDRIRISHRKKCEFFFRSMSSKKCLGGLAPATREASWILAASGRQIVMIETVGVGQSEMDIVATTDSVLVVLTPESGDTIQTMKAGLMEIADIFAVNKSDMTGAENMQLSIEDVLDRKKTPAERKDWRPPVFLTSSQSVAGISELYEGIIQHKKYLLMDNRLQKTRKEQFKKDIIRKTEEAVSAVVMDRLSKDGSFDQIADQWWMKRISPLSIAQLIVKTKLGS